MNQPLVVEASKETIHNIPTPIKTLNLPAVINPGSLETFVPLSDLVDSDEVEPSKLPTIPGKNDVLTTEEGGNSLLQAVIKTPTLEPVKQMPVANRKEGDHTEVIRVEEMTANLHANDQPVYRVVTQPTTEKKANKKSGSVKEQQTSSVKPFKGGHPKKSSSKGLFTLMHLLLYINSHRKKISLLHFQIRTVFAPRFPPCFTSGQRLSACPAYATRNVIK